MVESGRRCTNRVTRQYKEKLCVCVGVGRTSFLGAQQFAKQHTSNFELATLLRLAVQGVFGYYWISPLSVLEDWPNIDLLKQHSLCQQPMCSACILKKINDNVFCHGTLLRRVKGPPAVFWCM